MDPDADSDPQQWLQANSMAIENSVKQRKENNQNQRFGPGSGKAK
jgi:hypothetical protein